MHPLSNILTTVVINQLFKSTNFGFKFLLVLLRVLHLHVFIGQFILIILYAFVKRYFHITFIVKQV